MDIVHDNDPLALELLDSLIKSGALLEGHFLLRSGLHSRYFLQCALLLQNPLLCARYSSYLAQKIQQLDAQTIVSAAIGGILIGHEVAKKLGLRHIYAEKDKKGMVLRRFQLQASERVIVVEDVMTTGGTVKAIMDSVRAKKGEVCAVGCLVDRSGGNIDFGVPCFSLLKLKIETFPAENLPEDLKKSSPVRP
ncbi:orotate phosphoribosyltransferase [Methylacidiphilum caldifontis]|uniref:Orotate phosphoribosyltransferase n=1 Tax=Methylacidiphilum caldifontis TaxID=2795386 RepID=A0A4Y8PA12_9BACT|nr:orotate phosphoribosyltransferase [Methylacidiphilum caldifontis]QSR89507.1 orotate phosphoribosyltransferase [Methylacidiphilum caldifontis]TFE67198.1 orotate phosphoribosyltransferase [Methylacidiphilum caldifontis]